MNRCSVRTNHDEPSKPVHRRLFGSVRAALPRLVHRLSKASGFAPLLFFVSATTSIDSKISFRKYVFAVANRDNSDFFCVILIRSYY